MTTARRPSREPGRPGGRPGPAGGAAWALRAVLGFVRRSLWPVPAIGILMALAAGLILPVVDEGLAEGDTAQALFFVFGGGPSAARDLLAAIAGSLISVTGVTFSLTVVALQLGSSQYSPRLLQTFVTDRFVQLTLAQLMATFVYALTVLRTVRTESATESESAFVPRLSITVAYVLTLGSVLALVLFLGHLAKILRVETMLRDVHDEAGGTLDRELDGSDDGPRETVELPPGPSVPVLSRSSGFLVDVDGAALVAAARELDVTVLLAARIGDSVVEGTPLAHAWPSRPGGSVDAAELRDRLGRSVRLGFERSPDRDVGYSLRKIMDVAARALSPGINDATTAVHALSHASDLLGDLVTRPLDPTPWRDDDGVLRLLVPQWRAGELLDLVLEEMVQYGAGHAAVLRRTAALLREVGWRARGRGLDDALRERLRQLADVAAESTRIPPEEPERWSELLEAALEGRWPAEVPAGAQQSSVARRDAR